MSALIFLILFGLCFAAGVLAGLALAHELRLYRRACKGGMLDFTDPKHWFDPTAFREKNPARRKSA